MKAKRPLPELKKEIGIWIRVSTEDQAQGDSPKHHETRARAYAQSRDWIVREVYDLAGVSGKSVADHPEAKRMMEDVRKGRIQGLIFSKLARLARNTRELLDFADFFETNNADLVSLQESIDTSTPSGRLFYTMIAAMAQWEREEITDRINATIAVRAKTGKPLNGRPAFGYKFDKTVNKVVPDPQEAPVRRLMYELFAEYQRKGAVVDELNRRGYRNRKGTLFSRRGVEFLISDPTAKGEYRANYTYLSEDKKELLYKPEHEWVVTQVDPIVSKELWERCNATLDNRKCVREPKLGPRAVHTFGGLIKCHCGEKMYVKDNTPKYVCRKCRNKISIEDIEALFREHLTSYLLAPEKASAYVASANKFLTDKAGEVTALKTNLRAVKEEADKVFQLYYAGGLTADQFKFKFQPIDDRREQLEKEVAVTEAAVAAATVDGMSTDVIMADAKQLYDRWPSMPSEEKRKVAETLTRQIVVKKNEVEIDFIYLPTLEAMGKSVRNPVL